MTRWQEQGRVGISLTDSADGWMDGWMDREVDGIREKVWQRGTLSDPANINSDTEQVPI